MTLTADTRHPVAVRGAHMPAVGPQGPVFDAQEESRPAAVAPIREGAHVAFARFREACEHTLRPILCFVDETIIISNAAGAGVLRLLNEPALRLQAHQAAAGGRSSTRTVVLSDGRTVRAVFETIEWGAQTVGVLIRIHDAATPAADDACRLPGLAGESVPWRSAEREAVRAAHSSLPTLLFGERGTGKTAMARAALALRFPESTFRVVDCAVMAALGSGRMLHDAVSAPSDPLLLTHVDALPEVWHGQVERVVATVRAAGRVVWCTANGGLKTLSQRLDLDTFDHVIQLPPLRHRADDIPLLLAQTFEIGATTFTPPRVTPEATQVLMRYRWPHNVSQLIAVLRGAVATGSRPWIGVPDLPLYLQRDSARTRLSPYETAEADVIRHALKVCEGNKSSAAALLGISRSTLYRKVRRYDLEFRRLG